MSHHAPHFQPVTTPGLTKITAEAGGYVVTCGCRWLKFFPTDVTATDGRVAHEKKCKAARGDGE